MGQAKQREPNRDKRVADGKIKREAELAAIDLKVKAIQAAELDRFSELPTEKQARKAMLGAVTMLTIGIGYGKMW